MSSTLFTGTSRYSSDFNSIIERAVSIATLPITQYESVLSDLEDKATALTTLQTDFTSLQTAVESLDTALGLSSLTATSTDSSVAKVALSDGATAGTYTLEVTSMGAYTNTMSQDGLNTVTDSSTGNISTNSSFTLTVNGAEYTYSDITTLDDLVDAINSDTSAGVTASIVNVGSTSSPDYRLSIQNDTLGADTIMLKDGTDTTLLDTLTTGSLATYKVNGRTTEISSDTRTITLAPGVTVTLIGTTDTGDDATTITVAKSTTAISSALSSFVTAYNTVVSDLATHRGSNDGALTGQSIVSTLEQTLRSISGYSTGNSGISSLTSLGLEFDSSGTLSFNSSTFSSATTDNLTALWDFLGSADTSGFLNSATNKLDMLLDSTDGILTSAISTNTEAETSEQALIDATQTRVDLMETNLISQMSTADAAIAVLEQEATYYSGLFDAMDTATTSITG